MRTCILPTTPAERKICFATLSCRGIRPIENREIATTQMRSNYYIVDVNNLKPTLHWHNTGPHSYFHAGHHDCIDNIENF